MYGIYFFLYDKGGSEPTQAMHILGPTTVSGISGSVQLLGVDSVKFATNSANLSFSALVATQNLSSKKLIYLKYTEDGSATPLTMIILEAAETLTNNQYSN